MNYYKQIFRRKSFHIFKNTETMTEAELEELKSFCDTVKPLDQTIKTQICIVPEKETTCKRGGQYCILFYSEAKGEYLRNIGYIGEQIDLYLASKNIGALWFGIGKPKEMQMNGLDYVIMISIAKMPEDKFRKDMFKAKRKPLEEIWDGDTLHVAEIVRFTPSACNTQPWIVENTGNELMVYRYKKPGKRGIMPADKVRYYNKIDIGIFLFMLETCLEHENYSYERALFEDKTGDGVEKTLVGKYTLKQIQLPSKIQEFTKGKTYTVDDVGMSGNQVLIFDEMVLKIEDGMTSMDEQVRIMQWLNGKVPVPQVLAYEVADGHSYLLMSRICGKMSCDSYYLENPHVLLEALASGLKMLWEIDVTECPITRDLDVILAKARMRVENNCVDLENVEPTTFSEGGFESPSHLLEWLENNRPSMEPVFSHGDYCLPNIFLENGQVKGFIDLGNAGIADKWCDIALCYRSLKHNFDGTYGGKTYEDFNPDLLFEKLEIAPNWDKIKYYTLLDELF